MIKVAVATLVFGMVCAALGMIIQERLTHDELLICRMLVDRLNSAASQ